MPPDNENSGLNRVRFQLRAKGVEDQQTNPHRTGTHTRGYLPHVKVEGAEYFITFRLADSLPREVLLRYEQEKEERLDAIDRVKQSGLSPVESELEIAREFRRHIERYLDQGAGACHLRRPEIAELVAGALKHFHEQRYLLGEWVIMHESRARNDSSSFQSSCRSLYQELEAVHFPASQGASWYARGTLLAARGIRSLDSE